MLKHSHSTNRGARMARSLLIRYCASCGYAPWSAMVASAVARGAPGWTVEQRAVADAGTFEVDVAGEGEGGAAAASSSLWSKAATGQPVDGAGVGAVAEAVVAELRRRER